MRRHALDKLNNWKLSRYRQPLILKGARQVGKTHLLKDFGRLNFSRVHYFNFEEQPEFAAIFAGNLDVDSILRSLKIEKKELIEKQELIIFDEIQDIPRALTALKYFAEYESEIFICAAGSLLGVTLAEESFPVGKVNFQYLSPLKFSEFLLATDVHLANLLEQSIQKPLNDYDHQKLIRAFNFYAAVGGLPKAVQMCADIGVASLDIAKYLAEFHDNMIRTYQSDFVKHAGRVNAVHISSTFSAIPSQLAAQMDGSTQRFRFKDVIAGIRGLARLEGPINWLTHAGLCYKVKLVKRLQLPLESFTDESIFKLYLFDSGLLLRMLRVPFVTAVEQDYGLHKGFVMENIVLNQMIEDELSIPYFWQENKAEVDFVQIIGQDIVPIEIKSGHKIAAKSLSSLIRRYQPKYSIRLSAQNYSVDKDRKIYNLPLYLAESMNKILEREVDVL